ncbi:MAG: phospho-sugar mutase [Clostridia bacterium]|nr:phospho-sugar mutase [Clostridia bacterium]
MAYLDIYNKWLNSTKIDDEARQTLKSMTDDEISDAFYRNLEFGTAGLRGVMGVGPNRMNKYTVRLATQGLANEISQLGENAKTSGVVIAFDSRNNSQDFALECAKVLSKNDIKVYLFDSLRPTPELSFAVRFLKCIRGINITASHNPKEYNGYKVYGEDGGQLPPDSAQIIMNEIESLDIFDDVAYTENPTFISVGKDIDDAYIAAVKEQSLGIDIPKDFKVIYTPLHGAGNLLVRRILKEIGADDVFVVPEQEKPNGDFPTVISPNPENPDAFTIAIEYAKKQKADLIFGTDPDSDRIGVVTTNSDGEYIVLNGNQTGSLLANYILKKESEKGNLKGKKSIIKTVVTTDMISKIANYYGAECIDVLTGFKFIGEQIKLFEANNEFDRYVFGLEESYGYLRGTYARDKDAVVASMLICEMAADYYNRGMTLYDGLLELYKTYGHYKETLITITLKGQSGAEKIQEIMCDFRSNPPKELAGFAVNSIKDYSKGIDNLPKSNVLKFFFEKGWLAVRPSGTEPKIKFYISVFGDSMEKAEETTRLIQEFVNKATAQ